MEFMLPPFYTPPRHLHCLSYPDAHGDSWRSRALATCPPEPLFRDLTLLRRTRAFDPAFYLRQYPDVAAGERDPAEHYLFHGAGEGRLPHPSWVEHPPPAARAAHGGPQTPLLNALFQSDLPGPHPLEYGDHKPAPPISPPLWLDMRTSRFRYEKGRQLISFVIAALEAGSPVIITPQSLFSRIPHSASCLHTLLGLAGVWQLEDAAQVPDHAIRITDHDQPGRFRHRRIRLHLIEQPGEIPCLPFPPHTSTQLAETQWFLDLARSRRRRIPVLFAGRAPLAYRFTAMARRYRLLSRHQFLASIRSHFRDRCETTIADDRHFQEYSPDAPPIVLIDARRWSIIPPCWLDRLGYARFFLCPPGALHPLSHHLVEAMAVGTVPILEYDALLNPPLQDGVNCLTFRGRKGLLETVERAIALDNNAWEQLHQGAIDYYETHLRYPQMLAQHLAPGSSTTDLALPFLHR